MLQRLIRKDRAVPTWFPYILFDGDVQSIGSIQGRLNDTDVERNQGNPKVAENFTVAESICLLNAFFSKCQINRPKYYGYLPVLMLDMSVIKLIMQKINFTNNMQD